MTPIKITATAHASSHRTCPLHEPCADGEHDYNCLNRNFWVSLTVNGESIDLDEIPAENWPPVDEESNISQELAAQYDAESDSLSLEHLAPQQPEWWPYYAPILMDALTEIGLR